MGLSTDLTLAKSKKKEEVTPVEPINANIALDAEKNAVSATPSEKAGKDTTFTANAQAGVKRVEAATTVWTKWHLIGAYAMRVSKGFVKHAPNADSLQHLVDLLRDCFAGGRGSRS